VKFLADDSLEGRNTGSEGLRKAQAYAVEQLQKAGFQPAGTDGFYQPVRFTQFQVNESKSIARARCRRKIPTPLVLGRCVHQLAEHAQLRQSRAPLVFIGYGLKISREKS